MLKFLSLFSLLFILLSCTPAKEQMALQRDEIKSNSVFDRNLSGTTVVIEDINPWVSLASQFSMMPGLTRADEQVVVRGGRAPLYVLDNTIVGRCLFEINRMVWADDIERVTFLRGAPAVVYGPSARGGVIVIETKWLNDDEEGQADSK